MMDEDDINGLIQRCKKTKAQISRCICSRQFSFKIEIKSFFNSKCVKISKSWHALAPHL